MILKSMSRKTPSFGQLIRYIDKSAVDEQPLLRNLTPLQAADRRRLVEEFRKNSELLPPRKNGNMLYHEILSVAIIPGKEAEQKNALRQTAQRYLELRADGLMAFGRMHHEPGHIHYHFVLSANAVRARKRVRMAKLQLRNLQREVEIFIQDRFPDLSGRRVYSRQRETEPRARNGEEESRTSRRLAELESLGSLHEVSRER